MEEDKKHCFYCGAVLRKKYEMDHFPIPSRSGGGRKVPVCISCHDMKDRFKLEDWSEEWYDKIFEDFVKSSRETKIFLAKILSFLGDAVLPDEEKAVVELTALRIESASLAARRNRIKEEVENDEHFKIELRKELSKRIKDCLDKDISCLNDWQRDFLLSVKSQIVSSGRYYLSDRQEASLVRIELALKGYDDYDLGEDWRLGDPREEEMETG